jgi:protein TonB
MSYSPDKEMARAQGEFARYLFVPVVLSIILAGGVFWIRQLPVETASSHESSTMRVQVVPSSAISTPSNESAQENLISSSLHEVVPKADEARSTVSEQASRPTASEQSPLWDEPTHMRPSDEEISAVRHTMAAVSPQTSLREKRLYKPEGNADAPPDGNDNRRASNSVAVKYQSELLSHIGRFRRYPPAARRERLRGTARVLFRLRRDGAVEELWLKSGSGQAVLDNEAIDTIRRAQPLPPIPASLPSRLNVELPVEFLAP